MMNWKPVFNNFLRAGTSLCLGSALFIPVAQAQFNGPALTSSTTVNQPAVLTTDPAILYPAVHEIRLFPSDQIAVHLYGSLDYVPMVRVGLDGSIDLPLIGTLQVKGLTLEQTERLIEQKLIAGGMYRNPQVNLQITDSPNQVVTIAGEIHAVVPIVGQRRLMDVISIGGGLTPLSSHVITIQRPSLDQPIVVDLGNDPLKSAQSDIPIFAGDTILVARTGAVYMIGAFKSVGAVPLQQNTPLTLMQAATIAGGPGFEGKMNDLHLIRTIGTNRTVVRLDMDRVLKGRDPDPVLQTDDIIFLPSSSWKAAIKSGGLSTVVGFASILAIALGR